MRIRNVENKVFFAKFIGRLFAHNVLKDSQNFLPKANYAARYGTFPRYFSGWYLFVPSKDLAVGELIHKKLNGLDLVAYRNKQGTPVIHSNRCTHMDGLFGLSGSVVNGQIICGYHRYAFENGVPMSGPSAFRDDPSRCIPCHRTREVNGLVMFWFDADAENGVGEPTWALDLPDVTRFPRRAFARSITPTHMAPLHENIVDDQHFVQLHKANNYRSDLEVYREKHRFCTRNLMTVDAPKLGPFGLSDVEDGTLKIHMDSEFHGLGIHINTVRIGGFEATAIHCTTPIEDEVTEWTICLYMKKRSFPRRLDIATFLNLTYPASMFAQTYFLHTQDRRVFFESAEYRFYEDAPKGFHKVNAFRRWIHEELMGEDRPMTKDSIPTRYTPTHSAAK